MRVTIATIAISLLLSAPAYAEPPEQLKRNAIGNACHSMIIHSDPAWIVKAGKEGYRSLCTCTIDRVLDVGFTKDHVLPSLYSNVLPISSEGRHLIRRKLMACARDMPEGTGPKIKIPKVYKPQSW